MSTDHAARARSVRKTRPPAPEPPRVTLRQRTLRVLRRPEFGALVGTAVVYAFFVIFAHSSGFLTVKGTASWLNDAAELGIIALPVAMLMIAGEFDLSVGSMLGAASMIVAVGTGYEELPLWLSIVIAFAVAAAVGLANGFMVVRTGLPSFVVTLAGLFVLAGLTLGISRWLTGTTQVGFPAKGSAKAVFGSSYATFNVSILWWVGLAVICFWVLSRTVFGNWIFATGGAEQAARNAGVKTVFVKISLFVSTAMAAALVGVIQAVEVGSGDVLRGFQFEFKAIIAAVIGGVLLTGGYGSAVGAFLGAATYGIVDLGIFYTGWNTDWFQAFLGVLLLIAVLANSFLRRKAMTAR